MMAVDLINITTWNPINWVGHYLCVMQTPYLVECMNLSGVFLNWRWMMLEF